MNITKSSTLTVAQAAIELGVTPRRVTALITAGRLKATRIGKRLLVIQRRDLDAVRVRVLGRPKITQK